jgi:hypothetical protein
MDTAPAQPTASEAEPPTVPKRTGERLPWIDKFFLTWGPESLKQSVPALNDVLGKLITLNSALIGGGFVGAKGEVLPFGWTVAAIGFLIVSLVASLWGIYPRGWDVNLNNPNEIRAAEYGAIRRKSYCLATAFGALVVAFLLVFAGVIAKGPPAHEEPKPTRVIIEPPAR